MDSALDPSQVAGEIASRGRPSQLALLAPKAGNRLRGGFRYCRAELGLGDDYYQTSAGQREKLLQGTDRLDKTSNRIQQGRQQLLETEVRAGVAALCRVWYWVSQGGLVGDAAWHLQQRRDRG